MASNRERILPERTRNSRCRLMRLFKRFFGRLSDTNEGNKINDEQSRFLGVRRVIPSRAGLDLFLAQRYKRRYGRALELLKP